MNENPQLYVTDDDGRYTFSRAVAPDELLEIALQIVEGRMARGECIRNPAEVKEYLSLEIGMLEREVFCCLFLDHRYRVLAFERLFTGTIDGAAVHPREIAKRSLQLNAAAAILAHNHPSGSPDESWADRALTKHLRDALALVDVRVLDHIVVAGREAVSFAERALL